MADRTVKVILTSDYRGLQQGLRAARQETGDFARDVSTGLGEAENRAHQFARGVGTAAAKATAATVAAGAAMTVSLAKVGVQYNSLEATSRKAMETILGSSSRAAGFMDELFAFTQESPFDRGVFIQGAQQLAAFNMEAGRIIPTLGAVQDAVAAMGGGNQEIAETVNILGNIQSTSRFTAHELNQLSRRIGDAAALIGTQMNMTAAEVREGFTAGTIDAGEAMDALVAGMTARFDGAAADMKEMWGGALQSITARWRNIGSDLAEPFVSTQGGGAAIDWANQVADMLSSLRTSVVPALVPQLERAAVAASNVVDQIERFVDGLSPEGVASFMAQVKPMAPALAGVAGALTAVGAGSIRFLPAVNPVVGALTAMAAVSPEVRSALGDLAGALIDLGLAIAPVVGNLATMASWLATEALAPAVSGIASALSVLATVLTHLEGPLTAAAVAFVALKAAMAGAALIGTLQGLAKALQMVSAAASLQGVSRISVIGGMMQQSAAQAGGFSRMLLGVPPHVAAIGAAVGVGVLAFHAFGRAARASAKRVDELTESMLAAESAAGGAANWITGLAGDFDPLLAAMVEARVTAQDLADAALEGGPAWEAMQDRILGTDAAMRLGLTSSSLLRSALNSMPGEVRRAAEAFNHLQFIANGFAQDMPGLAVLLAGAARKLDELRDAAEAAAVGHETAAGAAKQHADALRDLFGPLTGMQDALDAHARAERHVSDASRGLQRAQADAARASSEVTRAQSGVAEALSHTADRAQAAKDAISGLASAQRAAMDPLFAMLDALDANERARQGRPGSAPSRVDQGTQQVLRDGRWVAAPTVNRGTPDEPPSALEVAKSALGVQAAATQLAGAVRTGQVSLAAARQALQQWVAQGLISGEQAAEIAGQFDEVALQAERMAGGAVDAAVAQGIASAEMEAAEERARLLAAAQDRVASAQRGASDAADRVRDAQRNVSEAQERTTKTALDVNVAALELKDAFDEGTTSVGEAREELMRWVEMGLIAAPVARSFADELERAARIAREISQAKMKIPTFDPTVPAVGPAPRARGGNVWPGRDFLVGEDGPEVVRFGRSGTVFSASESARMLGWAPQDSGPLPAPVAARHSGGGGLDAERLSAALSAAVGQVVNGGTSVTVNGYNRDPESIISEAVWKIGNQQGWALTGRADR